MKTDEELFDDFRYNLVFYRESKKWSQSELAIQSNLSNGMIGNIEAGKARPSFESILKLSRALCVHPADLFLRDASKSKADVKKILDELLDKDLKNLVSQKFSL